MLALYFHGRFNWFILFNLFLFMKESLGQMNSPRSWLFGGWKVSWWVWLEKYDPSQRGSAPRGISDAENIMFNTCLLSGKTNQFNGIQENKVRGNHSCCLVLNCVLALCQHFQPEYFIGLQFDTELIQKIKMGTAYIVHLFQQTAIYLP